MSDLPKKALVPVLDDDVVVLRLASTELGAARDLYYDDLADIYGDEHLFGVASSLRSRLLVGWGTQWNHCWLTEDGEMALIRATEQGLGTRKKAKGAA